MCNKQFLSPHFELQEFVASRTAKEHRIDNTPPAEAVENLRALCVHTLEPLREALGHPIIITSGYRAKTLNNLLANHSNKSQHMQGCAADFYVGQAQSAAAGSKAPEGAEFQVPGSRAAGFQVPGSKIQDAGLLKHETGESPVKLETSSRRELLITAFRRIITDEAIDFDQLIIYPDFIHVSYVSRERNRHKLTRAFNNGTYAALTRAEALALGGAESA